MKKMRLRDELLKQLVDEAHARWLVEEDGIVDDITAVVVAFTHAGQDATEGDGQ